MWCRRLLGFLPSVSIANSKLIFELHDKKYNVKNPVYVELVVSSGLKVICSCSIMINGDCNPQTGRVIATAAGIFLISTRFI